MQSPQPLEAKTGTVFFQLSPAGVWFLLPFCLGGLTHPPTLTGRSGLPPASAGDLNDWEFHRSRKGQCPSVLSDAKLENIVCGHDYDGIGSVIKGADEVSAALQYCEDRVKLYDSKIKEYVASGMSVEDEPVGIALKLIGEVGCGMPDQLFLALHTVTEHLK